MGNIEGLFVAEEDEVKAAIGKHVYFGEILGKHSEICGDIDADEIVALTDDQDFIDKAIACNVVPTGYNPLKYLGNG
jgi:hypothetical protein